MIKDQMHNIALQIAKVTKVSEEPKEPKEIITSGSSGSFVTSVIDQSPTGFAK